MCPVPPEAPQEGTFPAHKLQGAGGCEAAAVTGGEEVEQSLGGDGGQHRICVPCPASISPHWVAAGNSPARGEEDEGAVKHLQTWQAVGRRRIKWEELECGTGACAPSRL